MIMTLCYVLSSNHKHGVSARFDDIVSIYNAITSASVYIIIRAWSLVAIHFLEKTT